MKNIISVSAYLFIFPLLVNCSSPLEDVEINDFKLLRVGFYITKNVSSDGTVSDKIEVHIRDKNYKNFELKGAIVKVNDTQMDFESGFLKNRYISDGKVLPDTKYKFVITLPNGESAISTVKTPPVDVKSISYQRKFSKGVDYSISWRKQKNPVALKFELRDDSFGENPSYKLNETIFEDKGGFVISGKGTKNYSHATKCMFSLSYKGTEELSNKFRSKNAIVEIVYHARDISVEK